MATKIWSGSEWVDMGAESLLALKDTPSTYAGKAKMVPVVKDTEDGVEFSDILTAMRSDIVSNYNSEAYIEADIIVVAGGGGGGGGESNAAGDGGGGGGAGGVIAKTVYLLGEDTLNIVIGTGGDGGLANAKGSNGSNSSLGSYVAFGGGAGGGDTNEIIGATGSSGGSGGGAAHDYASSAAVGGSGVRDQGYNGGSALGVGTTYRGGGGGGGGSAPGITPIGNFGGKGGDGITTFLGAFGGGGGGGPSGANTKGSGGNGGGGSGATNTTAASVGAPNTGGGGGGGSGNSGAYAPGAAGGSGIVALRYSDAYDAATVIGSVTSSTSGGYRVYVWTGTGTIFLPKALITANANLKQSHFCRIGIAADSSGTRIGSGITSTLLSIPMDTFLEGDQDLFSLANNGFVVKVSGTYHLNLAAMMTDTLGSSQREIFLRIKRNGVAISHRIEAASTPGVNPKGGGLSIDTKLLKADIITFEWGFWSDSAGTHYLDNNPTMTYASIMRVPDLYYDADKTNYSKTMSGAGHITAKLNSVVLIADPSPSPYQHLSLDTILSKSSSAWGLSGGDIVIPENVTTVYVHGSVYYSTATGERQLYIRKNGSNVASSVFTSGSYIRHNVGGLLQVLPGDLIGLSIWQNSGTPTITDIQLSVFTVSSSQVLIGGTSGALISEQVLETPQTVIQFTGLNSLVDGDYTLEMSYVNSSIDNIDYYISINGTDFSGVKRDYLSRENNASDALPSFAFLRSGGYLTGVMRISVVNGTALVQGQNSCYGAYNSSTVAKADITSIMKPGITSITSLTLYANLTGNFAEGATFRLYGSNTPTQLIAYQPQNFTGLVGDRLLKAGEVSYIDVVAATVVPLRIQTEQSALYEYDIIPTVAMQFSNSYTTLSPNGTTTTTIQGMTSDGQMLSLTTFRIAKGGVLGATGKIQSDYRNATVKFESGGNGVTEYHDFRGWLTKHNELFTWSSLGTITFPDVFTGRIVIRRII